MSLETLQKAVAGLDPDSRQRLAAHIVALNDAQEVDYKEELANRVDSADSSQWFSIDDC